MWCLHCHSVLTVCVTVCRRPSAGTFQKVTCRGVVGYRRFACGPCAERLIWQDGGKVSRLVAWPCQLCLTSTVPGKGGASAYAAKMAAPSLAERKVSLCETWECDTMAHNPDLILINLGNHVS